MSSAAKRKNKKTDPIDIIIKLLIFACSVVGVVLLGMLAVEFFSGGEEEIDNGDRNTTVLSVEQTTTEPQITEPQVTEEPETTEPETTEPETTEPEATEPETTESQPTLVDENDRIIINPEQELWNLVVVNGTRAMPEGYVPQLATVAGSDVKMDYRVAPYYTAMYDAAKKDGITLTPYSGYRSYDRQKRNYNNLTEKYMSQYNLSREDAAVKAATVILPPGTSEHNLGLAMDICNTYDSFANQKEYAWLVEHAHEYGFILRYTAEKQPITGIVPEPWHWRFVGVEYAEEIKNSGLCLEEWLTSKGIAY